MVLITLIPLPLSLSVNFLVLLLPGILFSFILLSLLLLLLIFNCFCLIRPECEKVTHVITKPSQIPTLKLEPGIELSRYYLINHEWLFDCAIKVLLFSSFLFLFFIEMVILGHESE